MAWVDVPGSGGIWEYDNAPTEPADNTSWDWYRWNQQTNGIKTVLHLGTIPVYIYAYCRKKDDHSVTGELSKSYYDS